jgi:hypothetical protein
MRMPSPATIAAERATWQPGPSFDRLRMTYKAQDDTVAAQNDTVWPLRMTLQRS